MENLIKWNKYSNWLLSFTVIFWFTETIVFLFVYGWHLEAIGIEVYFDYVVGFGVWVWAVMFIMRTEKIINFFCSAKKIGLTELHNYSMLAFLTKKDGE